MSALSIPRGAGASSPANPPSTLPAPTPAPQHAHTSSLGTITEIASQPDLAALADLIDCGAPTSGQYAKNGLWDDESDSDRGESDKASKESRQRTMSANGVGNTSAGRRWRQRLSSTAGRASRPGASAPEGSTPSPWPWGRKMSLPSSNSNVPPPVMTAPLATSPQVSAPLASPPLASPTAPPLSAPLSPSAPYPFAPAATSSEATASPELPLAPAMPTTPFFPSSPVIASTHPLAKDTTDVLPEPVIPTKLDQASSSPKVTTIVLPAPPVPEMAPAGSSLKPTKSRSRLRSMGMGKPKAAAPELPKKVDKKMEVFEAPLSPVAETRAPLGPVANVGNNPMRSAQAQVLGSKRPAAINPKADKRSGNEDPRPKSAWKRGVERLWRSKSASGLRDSFQRRPNENDPPPPMPAVPIEYISGPAPAFGGALDAPAGASSLGVNNLTRSPSTRESVMTPIPHDDPIYSELDKRYPSYPARAPPGTSPVIADEDAFESDPFASVVSYASAGRAPSRASGRSPIPDFASLPPQPLSESTRPTSLKAGLIPRLRKSKSMASSRPTSIVGLFTDRKKLAPSPSPKISQLASFETTPTMDAPAGVAGATNDLEPPKPLFYDMFDIASEDEHAGSGEGTPAGANARSARNSSCSPTSLLFDENPHDNPHENPPPSPPAAEVSVPMSAPAFPCSTASPKRAPELLIESASGHSAELATPVPSSAPPHVTSYELLELDSAFLPLANSKQVDSSHPRPVSLAFDKSSVTGPSESVSFQDLYAQLGIWPEQAERWLQELPDREVITATPEPPTDDPARDDHSACDPSPLSTPGASWEAAIHSFPVVDDLVLPPSHTINYPTSYPAPVDYVPPDDATGHAEMRSLRSYMDGQPDIARTSHGAADSSEANGHSTHSSPRQRQGDRATSGSHAAGSEMWSTSRDGVARRLDGGSGSGSSSRASSRERRRPAAPAEGGWSLESDSSGDNDDVPLSQLHPQAGAAQQQRLVNAVRRREARRAERDRELRHTKSQMFERERERLIKREREFQREASLREQPREPRESQESREPREPRRSRTEWNGEGGVPADMLAGRLERVAVSSSSRQSGSGSAGVSRAPTIHHPGSAGSQNPMSRPRITRTSEEGMPSSPNHGAAMSRTPTIGGNSTHSGHSNHSGPSSQQQRDLGRGPSLSHPTSRAPSSSNNSGHSPSAPGASLGRSATTVSAPTASLGRSATTVSRRRALSSARDQPRSPAEAPPMPRRGVPVRCAIVSAAGERPLSLEVFPETTARDVLGKAREVHQLVDGVNGPTSGWVVYEIFSELGLERQLREYENIATVTRGWDAQAKGNCLVVRESHHANQTLPQAVGDSAPFVGGWVQLETKRGKWSKRWLETRGGHVFISKNEKGKDELQINTVFSDVYTPANSYPAPQRHVFAFKRLEPLASFENPSEHVHFISTDDATGWKLFTAAYGSRSYTLVSAQKHAQISNTAHALNRASSTSKPHGEHSGSHAHSSGTLRRSSRQSGPPLVELNAGPTRQNTKHRMDFNASGFTGKGLLGNI